MKAEKEVSGIRIWKGVPLPKRNLGVHSAISNALSEMEVGDCIDLALTGTNSSGIYIRSRLLGIKVARRTIKNGAEKIMRVWRIK